MDSFSETNVHTGVDEHMCLLCREVISGLDNYITHRQAGNCCKESKGNEENFEEAEQAHTDIVNLDRQDANDFFQYFQLQHKSPSGALQGITSSKEECFDDHLFIWPSSQDMDHMFSTNESKSSESTQNATNLPSRQEFSALEPKTTKNDQIIPRTAEEQLRSIVMSPSQNDFMKQMDLINVSNISVETSQDSSRANCLTGGKWKIWNNDQDNDDIWSNMLNSSEEILLDDRINANTTEMTDNSNSLRHNQNHTSKNTSDTTQAHPVKRDSSNQRCPQSPDFIECQQTNRYECNKDLVPNHSSLGKRQPKPSKKYSEDFHIIAKKPKRRSDTSACKMSSSSKEIISCPTCNYRTVPSHFIKHLTSHYHSKFSKRNKGYEEEKSLILNHIEDIVRQTSPFKCDLCSFFCNWDEDFIVHWERNHLLYVITSPKESLWCSFCSFFCDSGAEMLSHLKSDRHFDIVIALSRVVPVVIRKVSLHHCHICNQRFRLNLTFKKHLALVHEDHLGNNKKRSNQNHNYGCFSCKKTFSSKRELTVHKKSKEHKKESVKNPEMSKAVVQKCEHCNETFTDLRDHIIQNHKSELRQCGLCGSKFALSENLRTHVKSGCKLAGVCKKRGKHMCHEKNCSFSSDSMSMIIYHRSIKHRLKKSYPDRDNLFSCDACGKRFSRSQLWSHVRLHGEFHRCNLCYHVYDTDIRLKNHIARVHKGRNELLQCPKCNYSTNKRAAFHLHKKRTHFEPTQCQQCGEWLHSFKRYANHIKLHASSCKSGNGEYRFHCNQPGCSYKTDHAYNMKSHSMTHVTEVRLKCNLCNVFTCKRKSELVRHMKNKHGEGGELKTWKCPDCKYSTSSRQHLDRHVRTVHSLVEDTLYHCHFCTFTSPCFDRLRKHMTKTRLHVGKCLFHCEFCNDFASNSQPEFKSHLLELHMKQFPSQYDILQYLKNYFQNTNEYS